MPLSKAAQLLEGWSLEMTARDLPDLEAAASLIPPGTRIPVAYLPNETAEGRILAARRIRELGFIPIPHIAARRFSSEAELEAFLAGLQAEAAVDHAFIVAGDAATPMGPYADALAVIQSGLLAKHGIRRVGISGYPEGHPDIDDARLWGAQLEKQQALGERGHDFAVVTQFAFDADPILAWLKAARQGGLTALVRIGVPGPASAKTLLKYAARCGVGASTRVMRKYGLSMSRLLTVSGPDQLITDLAAGLDPAVHGAVLLHLFPFGGLARTAQWVRDVQSQSFN